MAPVASISELVHGHLLLLVAGHGGLHDRTGRRAEAHVLVQLAQARQRAGQVEGLVLDGGLDQFLGQFEGQAADVFLAVLDHHLVDAALERGGGAAEGHRAAGFGLQGQGRVLQHLGHRDGVVVAHRLQLADPREARAQAVFEIGQGADRFLVGGARNNRLDRSVVAPEVGATQGPYA